MNVVSPVVDRILSRFAVCQAISGITPVSTSAGFSGARLWRIEAGALSLCLRRWPTEHPSRDRLTYIHRVLRHVARCDLAEIIPIPLTDHGGQAIVEEDGSLWELTRWLPGTADFLQNPTNVKLDHAMRLLAEFHVAAETFEPPSTATPPGIVARAEQLRRLMEGEMELLRRAITQPSWPQLATQAEELLHYFPSLAPRVLALLQRASQFSVPLQPCIRDIWHDHVLFHGERVTGLIDFGAMRSDHVAGDIARLLGSLVGDHREKWRRGLEAYQSRRPLTDMERELVTIYDRSGVLLSGMNWLKWIFLEGREFDNRSRINERLEVILARQRTWRALLHGRVGQSDLFVDGSN